jgi:hypothetical protein
MARPHGGNAVIEARLRARRPLGPADAHFVAGLIDAEGCFQIRPAHGGQRWECSLKVAVRNDDAALLRDVHRITGLGGVTQRRTSGSSRPQVQWHVESRLECVRLAELLVRHPLRGRKRLEAQVWSEAVVALAETTNPPLLPRLATEIRRLRRYVNPPHDIPAALLDDGWIPYFGGFFTGDGHLSLTGGRCRAVVKLRDDDRPLLESMAATTGLGRVYSAPSRGRSKPTAAWIV